MASSLPSSIPSGLTTAGTVVGPKVSEGVRTTIGGGQVDTRSVLEMVDNNEHLRRILLRIAERLKGYMLIKFNGFFWLSAGC